MINDFQNNWFDMLILLFVVSYIKYQFYKTKKTKKHHWAMYKTSSAYKIKINLTMAIIKLLLSLFIIYIGVLSYYKQYFTIIVLLISFFLLVTEIIEFMNKLLNTYDKKKHKEIHKK